MNKFINDNIAVFVLLGIALGAAALGVAIANSRALKQNGIKCVHKQQAVPAGNTSAATTDEGGATE